MIKFLYLVLALFIVSRPSMGQTLSSACGAPSTLTAPCVNLTWTNPSMTATQTNNAKGQETAGPGTAEIWACIGSATATQCVAGMMPAIGSATAPSGSGWVLMGTIPQAASAGAAGVPNLTWTALYQFAVRNSWTAGGGAGAFSASFPLTMPSLPATQPVAPNTPSGTIVVPTGV